MGQFAGLYDRRSRLDEGLCGQSTAGEGVREAERTDAADCRSMESGGLTSRWTSFSDHARCRIGQLPRAEAQVLRDLLVEG